MKTRIQQLDGLRAFAILAVIVHHVFDVKLLWMGVDLFFVLSGFLITNILLDRKEKGDSYFGYFYSRRVRRIIPPCILVLLVFGFLRSWEWVRHWPWYVFFVMNLGTALNSMGPRPAPFWSLAIEEQFYLVWPLVVLFVSRKSLPRVAIGLIVSAIAFRAIATPVLPAAHTFIYFLTPFRMDTLATGALLACIWTEHRAAFLKNATSIGWLSLLLGVSGAAISSRLPSFWMGADTIQGNVTVFLWTLLMSLGAMTLALRGTGMVQAILTWRPLRYLGTISYSMYLIHVLILTEAAKSIHQRWLQFLICLGGSVAYSSATWFLIEGPLTRVKAARKETADARGAVLCDVRSGNLGAFVAEAGSND